MEFLTKDPRTVCFDFRFRYGTRFWNVSGSAGIRLRTKSFGPNGFGGLIPDYYNLSASFQTDIKEVGRLRIGKILRKNRWMSDEEKMIYLQFYNEIEFWSFNTVSNEIKWYYIIIDILEV